jgi:hypothetical protein
MFTSATLVVSQNVKKQNQGEVVSMSKQKINVWGRDFELDVVFDCCEGEEVLPVQKEALNLFLSKPILLSDAKSKVEDYCINLNAADIGSTSIENIFKYVIPKEIYVQRPTDNSRVVGLLCNYKFDADNGLAVVFKNEQFVQVNTEDVIL